MAKATLDEKVVPIAKVPNVESTPEGGSLGPVKGIVLIVSACLIIIFLFSATFLAAVKINYKGLGEIVRPTFQHNAVLKYVLPPLKDPDDPKYLSDEELVAKYSEYRDNNARLAEEIAQLKASIEALSAESAAVAANLSSKEAELLEATEEQRNIAAEREKLEADKKAFDEMVANNDTEGFKTYFAQMNQETAEVIYKELVKLDLYAVEKEAVAKPFTLMTPSSAAGVMSELWQKDQQLTADVLGGMGSMASAQILEYMDPKVVADITKLTMESKRP